MAGDEAHVRQIAQQAMQNISQLIQIIETSSSATSGNLRSTHMSEAGGGGSTISSSSRPRPTTSAADTFRPEQSQHQEASVLTNSSNRYHPYNRYSPRNDKNNTSNAVTELRRRFPTAGAAATRHRPSRPLTTGGRASRGGASALGRPFSSGTATRDVMILKAGEVTLPSRTEKSQLELDGRIITGFDVNRSWEQEVLFKELETILPDEYKGIKFQIMKNCHGSLVPPNIPQGKKIDAKLLLKSLAPSSYIYIQLLHEPIPDDILDVPAFEQFEETVSSHEHSRQANDDSSEDPSYPFNTNPVGVGDVSAEKPFFVEILKSVPTNLMDPVEILKYLQQKIVTGRALEISSVDTEILGETNYITVDRENIIQTTFDELQFISNPRLTFQVDFMGEDSTDLGGPRKEWIRLLNREIKAKYFDHDLRHLLSKDYFYVGQIFAIALLQNGQIPSFLSEAMLQELVAISPSNQCVEEIQNGLETLGMCSALKKFPQLLHLMRTSGNSDNLTVQKLLQLFKPKFSEEGSNAFQKEKAVYHLYVRYLREVAANRRVSGKTTITLGHILQFATGASEEPVLGFELGPSLEFVIPQEQRVEDFQADSSDGNKTYKTIANFLPTSHTCSNILTLPRPTVAHTLPEADDLFNMYDICFGQEYFGIQ
eukprot:gene1054-382_t